MWDPVKINYSMCLHHNEGTCSLMCFFFFISISMGFVDNEKNIENHQTHPRGHKLAGRLHCQDLANI